MHLAAAGGSKTMQTHWGRILPAAGMFALIAFAADITTDYDHKADFSRYHTYSWLRSKASNSL